MAGYIALVHKDGGTSYGVSLPDAPGCISAGDTFEEAVAHADFARQSRDLAQDRCYSTLGYDHGCRTTATDSISKFFCNPSLAALMAPFAAPVAPAAERNTRHPLRTATGQSARSLPM
jgi:hypothetical protein